MESPECPGSDYAGTQGDSRRYRIRTPRRQCRTTTQGKSNSRQVAPITFYPTMIRDWTEETGQSAVSARIRKVVGGAALVCKNQFILKLLLAGEPTCFCHCLVPNQRVCQNWLVGCLAAQCRIRNRCVLPVSRPAMVLSALDNPQGRYRLKLQGHNTLLNGSLDQFDFRTCLHRLGRSAIV